jgi:hypothetical protein
MLEKVERIRKQASNNNKKLVTFSHQSFTHLLLDGVVEHGIWITELVLGLFAAAERINAKYFSYVGIGMYVCVSDVNSRFSHI